MFVHLPTKFQERRVKEQQRGKIVSSRMIDRGASVFSSPLNSRGEKKNSDLQRVVINGLARWRYRRTRHAGWIRGRHGRQNRSLSSFNGKVVQLRRYRRSERITSDFPPRALHVPLSSLIPSRTNARILFQSALIRYNRKSFLEMFPGMIRVENRESNVPRMHFFFLLRDSCHALFLATLRAD